MCSYAELCGLGATRVRSPDPGCEKLRFYGWFIIALMVRQSEAPSSIVFRHYSILPHRRQLLADGRPITFGDRAFDVLMALIEASGAVVSKDELLNRV